jgi:hypothetical protein
MGCLTRGFQLPRSASRGLLREARHAGTRAAKVERFAGPRRFDPWRVRPTQIPNRGAVAEWPRRPLVPLRKPGGSRRPLRADALYSSRGP